MQLNLKQSIKLLFTTLLVITMCFTLLQPNDVSAKVKINATYKTVYVGKSTTLKITGTKSKVKWSTSNKKIATVTSKGKVTGKKVGSTYIKAKVLKKTYKCKVVVKKAPAKKVVSSTPAVQQTPNQAVNGDGKVVCINPGHQAKSNSAPEPNAPNSSITKAKVTGGATGVSSRVAESQINLNVGLKLKRELEARGYTVIMTRESQNVDLSNAQRAQIGNKANITISLHCDSTTNASSVGAHTICMGKSNSLYTNSYKLAQKVISCYTAKTGISSRGVVARDDLTGLNWSTIPAIYIEMGFLSNAQEDQKISNDAFQDTMASGIADGVDQYFNS